VYQLLSLATHVLRRAGDFQSATAIDTAVVVLGGEAAPARFWKDLVAPELDGKDTLPPVVLRDYDELVAFARAALNAAAPLIGASSDHRVTER
jgi:hypothetical protein